MVHAVVFQEKTVRQGPQKYLPVHIPKKSLGDSEPVQPRLSNRERELLQLLTEGKRAHEIASHLSISIKTVETHRRNIMIKLNIKSMAELVKYAVREGISTLDRL